MATEAQTAEKEVIAATWIKDKSNNFLTNLDGAETKDDVLRLTATYSAQIKQSLLVCYYATNVRQQQQQDLHLTPTLKIPQDALTSVPQMKKIVQTRVDCIVRNLFSSESDHSDNNDSPALLQAYSELGLFLGILEGKVSPGKLVQG